MARGKAKAKQVPLNIEQFTKLKKPLEVLGKQIQVPGSFWAGRISAREKEALFKCTVIDFSIAYKPTSDELPRSAFQLQEMGEGGTGSLEHGDASGERFWMEYPMPFLKFYYATFPEEDNGKQTTPAAAAQPNDAGDGVCSSQPQPDTVPADVLPQFPNIRLSLTTPVYQYFTITADNLVEAGRNSGMFCAEFECVVEECDGRVCGVKRKIYHKRGKACSTSNLITHLTERAAVCEVHKAALAKVRSSSKNFIELDDGEMVQAYTFPQAFTHHVDLLWLRVAGLSTTMIHRPEFRSYVRGYDPKASFPHDYTLVGIAEAVDALQSQERVARIERMKKQFRGLMCIGLQLDMWTDTATHTSYGCVTMTSVEDPVDVKDGAQLWCRSEILDFNVFPYGAKTGENIKQWFLDVLTENKIGHEMIAGVTPDGAADGQCGLGLIETIAEKVDTCQLHILQRVVLFAIGLAGAQTKNADAKGLLRKHNRIVMLSNQSLSVNKSIRDAQLEAGVPPHQLLTLEKTATTRWGNQFKQLSKNCTLRAVIDPAVDKYKRENRGNKEAIVESNESEDGSKVGRAVPASEIGLTSADWEESQEMESFLSYPFDIKETIEKRGFCTGPQGLMLLYDLKENWCSALACLKVKEIPTVLTVEARTLRNDPSRMLERAAEDLAESVTKARDILQDELRERAFINRPSNSRLVLAYMSKQMSSSQYLSHAQNVLARTLYMQMLRQAVPIARVPTRSSPPRAKKAAKLSSNGPLFRGAEVVGAEVDSPTPTQSAAAAEFDPVADELKRWEYLTRDEYEKFIESDGLLNEFQMMWEMRERFPLHYIVFKQMACHLPHEGNVEQVFSRAGLLSDPNLEPAKLSTLVNFPPHAFV